MTAPVLAPVEKAVVAWIVRLPGTWTVLDWEKLTQTHEKALQRLVAAGMVEARIPVLIHVAGNSRPVKTLWRATGDFLSVLERLSSEHLTFLGYDLSKVRLQLGHYEEARLTHEGELAKQDLSGQHEFNDVENPQPGLPFFMLSRITGGPDGSLGITAPGSAIMEKMDDRDLSPAASVAPWFTLDVMGGQAATHLDDLPENRENVDQLRLRLRAVAVKREPSLAAANDFTVVRTVKAWLITEFQMAAADLSKLPVAAAAGILEKAVGGGTPAVTTVHHHHGDTYIAHHDQMVAQGHGSIAGAKVIMPAADEKKPHWLTKALVTKLIGVAGSLLLLAVLAYLSHKGFALRGK